MDGNNDDHEEDDDDDDNKYDDGDDDGDNDNDNRDEHYYDSENHNDNRDEHDDDSDNDNDNRDEHDDEGDNEYVDGDHLFHYISLYLTQISLYRTLSLILQLKPPTKAHCTSLYLHVSHCLYLTIRGSISLQYISLYLTARVFQCHSLCLTYSLSLHQT